MTFRERGAWITLATTVTIYGGYFGYLGLHGAQGAQGAGDGSWLGPLIAAVVCLIVAQVALSIVSAVADPREAGAPADERDRLIDLEATRTAFFVLQAGVFLAFGALLVWPAEPRLMANAVLLAMVVGESVRAAFQVAGYRRLAA